jgi:hypothetical protein
MTTSAPHASIPMHRTGAPFSCAALPLLAAVAAQELALREKHYPAMIERREIEQGEATADLRAWRAIAALFAAGAGAEEWRELEAAADRALVGRDQACRAKPGNAYLESRRAGVRWILEWIIYFRAFYARRDRALPPLPFTPTVPVIA